MIMRERLIDTVKLRNRSIWFKYQNILYA